MKEIIEKKIKIMSKDKTKRNSKTSNDVLN